jgi:hypothetical protein
MPTTRTITVYKFNELSEQAQHKALEKFWDINVDHDWQEHLFEDASSIGVKITEFDLDRNRIKGNLTKNTPEAFKLARKHGKDTEIFRTAQCYLDKYIQAFIQWYEKESQRDGAPSEWSRADWLREFAHYDDAYVVIKDYSHSILEDYLIILRREYEHLTSREQIIESIQANGYEFYEDGSLA